jgi:hypothetical protein
VREAITLVFSKFAEFQSIRQVHLWLRQEGIDLPAADYGPEGPIVRNCTVGPRISDLDSSRDCLCLAVLRAWLAAAGFIACNHGMQMELPGLSAAVLPHWTQ